MKLQEQDSDLVSPTAQHGLKRHTIIYPQQPNKLAGVLPPAIGEALTFICVVFVGELALTKGWLQEKVKPLVVCHEKNLECTFVVENKQPLIQECQD